MKTLQIWVADGSGLIKLSIVKILGHGFYLTKPSLKAQKKGCKGPYQITHAAGCRLASASKPEVLEQVYLAVVANPTVQVALTEMSEVMGHAPCWELQKSTQAIWLKHMRTMDAAVREAYTAFVHEATSGN